MRRILVLLAFTLACAKPASRPQRITRIVTLAPNLTEIVFAIGAGDRVVATDDFSDTPPAAARLPKVGGVQPSIERIVAARPDIVLVASSVNPSALTAARLPVTVVKTDRIDDIPAAMERLGTLLDAPDAPRVAQKLRESLAAQRRVRAHPPRVLFVAWASPLYVAGRDTFAGDLIALCGGRNAVELPGWPQYSIERVAAAPPDIILASGRLDVAPLLAAAPGVAARSRVAGVDENRFTRPGPRVAEAAADLNRILDAWERSQAAELPRRAEPARPAAGAR